MRDTHNAEHTESDRFELPHGGDFAAALAGHSVCMACDKNPSVTGKCATCCPDCLSDTLPSGWGA